MLSSLLVFVYLFVSSDYFLQLFVITCRWVCVFCYELHINVDAEAVSRLTHGVCSSLLILCMWLIFHLHFLLQFVQRQSRNIELIKLFYVFWCKTVVRTWFLVTLTTLFDAAQLVSGNISPDYLRISVVEVLTQRFFSTCAAHLICRFLLLKRSLIAMPDKATEGIPEGCS